MDTLEQGVIQLGSSPFVNKGLTQHTINSKESTVVQHKHIDYYNTAHSCLSPW